MKITAAESFSVFAAGPRPGFIWRKGLQGSPPDGQIAVLRIRTDEGAEGVAVASRRGSDVVVADALDRYLRDELIGADPLQREWLWHRMWELDRTEEMTIYLLGLVDAASVGPRRPSHRHADVAVAGRVPRRRSRPTRRRRRSPAPRSTWRSPTSASSSATRLIKLHAFGDARQRCPAVRGVREHVGDDYPLMYDGSAGFDLSDAVYVGDALADAGYLWYEEPIREFSRHRVQVAGRAGPGTRSILARPRTART